MNSLNQPKAIIGAASNACSPQVCDDRSEIKREHDRLDESLRVLDMRITRLAEQLYPALRNLDCEGLEPKMEQPPFSALGQSLRSTSGHVEALTRSIERLSSDLAL